MYYPFSHKPKVTIIHYSIYSICIGLTTFHQALLLHINVLKNNFPIHVLGATFQHSSSNIQQLPDTDSGPTTQCLFNSDWVSLLQTPMEASMCGWKKWEPLKVDIISPVQRSFRCISQKRELSLPHHSPVNASHFFPSENTCLLLDRSLELLLPLSSMVPFHFPRSCGISGYMLTSKYLEIGSTNVREYASRVFQSLCQFTQCNIFLVPAIYLQIS